MSFFNFVHEEVMVVKFNNVGVNCKGMGWDKMVESQFIVPTVHRLLVGVGEPWLQPVLVDTKIFFSSVPLSSWY